MGEQERSSMGGLAWVSGPYARQPMLPSRYGLVLTILLLTGCGGDNAQVNTRPDEVILRAEVVRFSGLSESERQAIGNYCCSYSRTGGWTPSDLERFEPEDGYFVRAVVNAEALAQLSLLHSCGGVTYIDTCSSEELSAKVAQILQASGSYRLYGKYMNRWAFANVAGEVPSTEKFEGFRLLLIDRKSPSRDHVTVGPLPAEPTRMRIQLYHNLNEQKRVVPSPELTLSHP